VIVGDSALVVCRDTGPDLAALMAVPAWMTDARCGGSAYRWNVTAIETAVASTENVRNIAVPPAMFQSDFRSANTLARR
jgi:hypothetical protein